MTIRRRKRRVAKPATLPDKPIELAKVIEARPEDDPATKELPGVTVVDRTGAAPVSRPINEEELAAVAKPRRRRSSVGGHAMKLGAPSRDGHKRRWVNDDGNRIAEMQELGYEFVSDTEIKTADPGSRVTRLVGTKANGDPLHAYLMETPDELYAQGEAEKEAANRLIDEAITAGRDSTGRLENQYGYGSITTDR